MTGRDLITRKSKTDDYETPAWATRALLKVESFPGPIWEPACGDGAIMRVLQAAGLDAAGTDIRPDADGGLGGRDFLAPSEYAWHTNHIITNPPYSQNQAQAFATRALDVASCKVAMLLQFSFLSAECRREWHQSCPLRTVYVFSSRATLWERGKPRPVHNGTRDYAWFVWEQGHKGKPTIEWLPDKEPK